MQTVQVPLAGRSYSINIGPRIRNELGAVIGQLQRVAKLVVIADRHVADLHLPALIEALPLEPAVLTFEPGEASKSLARFADLVDGLARARLERGDLVVAFGGGVAGDLAGFVAATWLRGIRFIQIPTTIEAAVDASVGGKTGLNHASGKNLIGAFHQPSAVLIDTDFLETLEQRDFIAGLGESIKHAVIRDADFLDWHERQADAILTRDTRAVTELIARNCTIKADVVARDEREQNLRAILNYGHTIGHAIELLAGYELRHGECVALGMLAENELACTRKLLKRPVADRIRRVLEHLGLPAHLPKPLDCDAIVEACHMDKKNRGGHINAIVVSDLGRPTRLSDVGDNEIRDAMTVLAGPQA